MPGSFSVKDKLKDLIDEDSSILLVMSRFGIRLGFGDMTVSNVCREQNINAQTFISVCNFVCGKEYDIEGVSLESIISYLKQAHSYFLDFKLPSIRRNLIEALDCSGAEKLSIMIIRFYDEYVGEVRKHMEYEEKTVFTYVDNLITGRDRGTYRISDFSSKHNHIDRKLRELRDIITRYYPQNNNYLLCSVLFDIIGCQHDLDLHCSIEDRIFVPATEIAESAAIERECRGEADSIVQENGSNSSDSLSQREKEIIVCITKGLSSKEIAEVLNISINTVTTHRRNITSKLQIHSQAGLAIYALANSLVSIEELA